MGTRIFIFIGMINFLFVLCLAKKNFIQDKGLNFSLPEEFKKTGLISSSTYQVYFKVRAEDYVSALKIAKTEIVRLTLEYLLQEPFVTVRISYNGKLKIKQMIEEKGRFIYIKKSEEPDLYDVVFHFTDNDLRNQLRNIK